MKPCSQKPTVQTTSRLRHRINHLQCFENRCTTFRHKSSCNQKEKSTKQQKKSTLPQRCLLLEMLQRSGASTLSQASLAMRKGCSLTQGAENSTISYWGYKIKQFLAIFYEHNETAYGDAQKPSPSHNPVLSWKMRESPQQFLGSIIFGENAVLKHRASLARTRICGQGCAGLCKLSEQGIQALPH